MVQIEEVVTRDETSGRFHKRYRANNRLMVDERCNLDAAGDYTVMPAVSRGIDGRGVPVGTDQNMLCQNCWPLDPVTDDEESTDSV